MLEGRRLGGDLDDHLPLPRRRARRPSSTASPRCSAATLNGVDLDLVDASPRAGSRSPTSRQHNVLVVSSVQPTPARGDAILRSVDPSDKLVYVWTLVRAGRRPARLGLLRPARPQGRARLPGERARRWTVPSNSAPESVHRPRRRRPACGSSRTPRASRRTSWWSTPGRSTRSASSAATTASASTAASRCAPSSSATPSELFRLTEQGLAFFGERFGRRSRRSATTRSSCRTWAARWRTGAASPGPTPSLYRQPARPTPSASSWPMVLLHEMAHMWFGDLVTMRWWDDLWLNEAFASWAVDLGRRDGDRLHRRRRHLPGRPGAAPATSRT